MVQKILKVGDSAAVTIPKKSLQELGLRPGDKVTVDVNYQNKTVLISPITKVSEGDQKIAKLTLNFINRYRKDLEALKDK